MRINPISRTPFNGTLNILVLNGSYDTAEKSKSYSLQPINTDDIVSISNTRVIKMANGDAYYPRFDSDYKTDPKDDLTTAYKYAAAARENIIDYRGDVYKKVEMAGLPRETAIVLYMINNNVAPISDLREKFGKKGLAALTAIGGIQSCYVDVDGKIEPAYKVCEGNSLLKDFNHDVILDKNTKVTE